MLRGYLFSLLAVLAWTSCSKNIPSVGLGEEIDIPFGKSGSVIDGTGSLDIEFTDLIEESRCPPGAQCIWAGRAIVELAVNSDRTFHLGVGDLHSIPPFVSDSAVYSNYVIDLLEVGFDKDRNYGKEEKYHITISVRRN